MDSNNRSGYQILRERLDAQERVTKAALELAAAHRAAKGNEHAEAVVLTKAKLISALQKRDDLSGAIEKALARVGVQRSTGWVAMTDEQLAASVFKNRRGTAKD